MSYFIKYNSPLEKRRVTKGYSQQEMSKHLGITQSQYSRIEKGQTNPAKHIKKLSEIFKQSLVLELYWENQIKYKKNVESKITQKFSRLYLLRKFISKNLRTFFRKN